MKTTIGLAACLWAVSVSPIDAGQYNAVLDVGDAAPAWTDLPDVDGSLHSLDDLSDRRLVVVVFTCNSCPYSVDYEDRLIDFTRRYAGDSGDVALVAINVNRNPEDGPEAMAERAREKGFNFPYLYDHSQEIARQYGATRTPELFLLDQQRRVVYMGAMDDSADESSVTRTYLEDAVAATLAARPCEPAETPPVGCAIRWARQRR